MYVTVRISPTISNEYANRFVFEESVGFTIGKKCVPLGVAQEMLADAEFNSDLKAQDVGPYGMPLHVFNAYRAFAKQLRNAIAKATA